jgi:FtsH-binding integral membrane protein
VSLFEVSLIFFAMAALLGLFLLSRILRNLETPKGISIFHGLSASTGLILLIIYACINQREDLFVFVAIFVAAALGGLILIYRDLKGKSIPKPLALLHGVLAVSAFVTMIIQDYTILK